MELELEEQGLGGTGQGLIKQLRELNETAEEDEDLDGDRW